MYASPQPEQWRIILRTTGGVRTAGVADAGAGAIPVTGAAGHAIHRTTWVPNKSWTSGHERRRFARLHQNPSAPPDLTLDARNWADEHGSGSG
jgi:hypothetical protein